MKVVIIERDIKAAPYRVIRAVGIISALFSTIVCILLIANNVSVKRLDPIHSPALAKLLEDLKANPKDAALREEIRELDLLTRRAFFTSQHFTQLGIILLTGGLAVTVLCYKSLNAYRATPPYPDSKDPKDDLVANALWARKSVTAVGLVLLGFALVLALPWKSPLDSLSPRAPTDSHHTPSPGITTARASSKPAAPEQPVSPPGWPTVEERLAQWPSFRGAGGGVAQSGKLPVTWPTETGAVWKSEIPLPGMNSPIIWKDRLLLAGADANSRVVCCYNTINGALLWKQTVAPIADPARKALKVADNTGYAASTMATDGTRAFAIFVDGQLIALTLDGKPAWERNLGLPENAYGYASSLAAFEDLLFVQMDRANDSYILAIDAATGKDRWKTARDFGPSWASPQVIQGPQGPLLLTAANPFVIAYNPHTGKEVWRAECLNDVEVAVTPFYFEGIVYAASESTGITAIDATSGKTLWKAEDAAPGICTPLVTQGVILFGLSEGAIVCLDARNGKELWRHETKGGIYASPILAGENVYMVTESGIVHVFKPAPGGYEAVGTPAVGDQVYATPAVTGNALFVRGVKNLYRFGS